MVRALVQSDVDVDVATTDDDGPGGRLGVPLGRPVESNGGSCYYFHKQTEFYKFSRPLGRWLSRNINHYDVVHVHALFCFASCAAAHISARDRVPYVIRPLGVLN